MRNTIKSENVVEKRVRRVTRVSEGSATNGRGGVQEERDHVHHKHQSEMGVGDVDDEQDGAVRRDDDVQDQEVVLHPEARNKQGMRKGDHAVATSRQHARQTRKCDQRFLFRLPRTRTVSESMLMDR